MKLLALDQSTTALGYCLRDVTTKKLLDYGLKEIKGDDVVKRISICKEHIKELIKIHKPNYIVFENVQQQGTFGVKTFGTLSELKGVVENLLYEQDMTYYIVAPVSWKASLGVNIKKKRPEQKAQTIDIVEEKFGITVGKSDDIADAIGLSEYGLLHIGGKV